MGKKLIDLVDHFEMWRLRSFFSGEKRGGVLLVSSGGIGDTMLFRLIIERFKSLLNENEKMHLVIRNECRHTIFLYPKNIEIHTIDYSRFQKKLSYRRDVCRYINSLNLRVAVSTDHLRHPLIDDVIIRASHAPKKLAFYPRKWPKYDSLLVRNTKQYNPLVRVSKKMEHRLIRWWHLANNISGERKPVPRVTLPKAVLPPPAHLERDLFVIHPFSAIKERQYSVEIFQSIIEIFPEDCDIAVSCVAEDLDDNPEFKILFTDNRVYADTSSLEKKASCLQSARLVVSIDTSIMHLATLCGAPTICLASSAHVVDSIPYDDRMMPDNVCFLYHDMNCRMCLGQCSLPLEDDRYACISRMDKKEILEKIIISLNDQVSC